MKFTKAFWKRQQAAYHKRAVRRFNAAKAKYPKQPWPEVVRNSIRRDVACVFYARDKAEAA